MVDRAKRREVRQRLERMLETGEVIRPEEVAAAAGLEAPPDYAHTFWVLNYVRRLVYETAQTAGIPARSLGRGKGFKAITSPEDVEAARKTAASFRQARAKREAMLNQLRFDLEEVSADAGTRSAGEVKAASK